MRATIATLLTAAAIMSTTSAQAGNPLMEPFATPHQTVPFSQITDDMWMPAVDFGIEQATKEIAAITSNPEAPTFDNTIVALERTGQDLDRVLGVYYALLSANSNDKMMELSEEISRKLSDYSTSIILNEDLWNRIRTVYDQRDRYILTGEQSMLLQQTYDSFAQSGATLEGADRETFKQLQSELSGLTTRFGQNVLRELAGMELELTAEETEGLPANLLAQLSEQAAEKEMAAGSYLMTFDQPTYMAVMKNAKSEDLRKRVYTLYSSRNTKGDYDNTAVMARIAELRRQIAALLGNPDFASYKLKRTMAGSPEAVYNLLGQLRDAYRPALDAEMAELQAFATQYEGKPTTIEPWNYSYYSNKLKNEKYAFDEEALRPYFELDNVIEGVFGLATKLYGLQFTQNDSYDTYHPDVKAFDVTDANGNFVGVLYTDFFPRASKRPGAWMTNFKEQWVEPDGSDSRPLVTIVMNFTKPTAGEPSLLTPYEVETFLHEFGHAIHGLVAQANYKSLSGTNVYRDFVELPSQFNENYMTEKEFLDGFARHYKTGEPIPAEMIERLKQSSRYGAAYACLRQLSFGYLDMAWHTAKAPVDDPAAFEQHAIESVAIFPVVAGTMTSPTFSHIFSGGYAAGYYSYKWAEVLDADAFAYFKEHGIFDQATAQSFLNNVLRRGGTEKPDELYRLFRGQDPTIDALLIRDGIMPEKNVIPASPKD